MINGPADDVIKEAEVKETSPQLLKNVSPVNVGPAASLPVSSPSQRSMLAGSPPKDGL